MRNWLSRVPWFVGAPAVVVATVVAAGAVNYFTGPLFHETCHNERNLLTGEFEASNCGEGAKVAKRQKDAAGATPTHGGGSQTGATGSAGTIVATGQFRDGDPGHHGEGKVEVQRLADGKLNAFLKEFAVTNGPDLFVYLVERDGRDEDGLNLGRLQANNGNQNYAIAAGTDIAKYGRVVIWCRQFKISFAFAELAATAASAPAASPPAQATVATTAAAQPTAQGPTPPPATTPAPTPVPTTAPAGPGVLAAGDFRDGEPGHQGSGKAQVQRLADGKLNLFLSNFSVTNGPDLVVVLSTDPGGSRGSVSSGLTLDKLKANNGNQNYAIPAGTDVTQFKSVIIYCKSFPTVFAYATLEAAP